MTEAGLPGDDYARFYYYYDGETGIEDYDPYYSATYGYSAGTGMIGTYDYVDLGDGDDTEGLFGGGYYEADQEYYGETFYYVWSNGLDYAYGYTFDADRSQGLYE